MGNQIGFFCINEDEMEFIEHITNQGGLLVDSKNQEINSELLKKTPIYTSKGLNPAPMLKFYIVFDKSKISVSETGFIEPLYSDVIEFSRSTISFKNNEYYVDPGRIWAEFTYYDRNGKLVKKEKFLKEKYNHYKTWIRGNFKLNKDKDYFIGSETYRLYKENGYRMKSGPMIEESF